MMPAHVSAVMPMPFAPPAVIFHARARAAVVASAVLDRAAGRVEVQLDAGATRIECAHLDRVRIALELHDPVTVGGEAALNLVAGEAVRLRERRERREGKGGEKDE